MRRGKFAAGWAALALLACLFPVAAWAQPPLDLVINDTNAPPFTTSRGDGFLDRVMAEVMRRAKLSYTLVKMPAERALISADQGIIDGDLTRIEHLEQLYPDLIRVPEVLLDWEFVAFGKDPNLRADWANLKGRLVGLITGWKIYEMATEDWPYVVGATGPEQLFELLDRDRIEVALHARWMGQYFIERAGLEGIHELKPPLARRQMYLYLNRKHAPLAARIAAALREVKQDGFYQRAWEETVAPHMEARREPQ